MYRLVKVHENAHLLEQCVALLNDEWPRHKDSRLRSINKSSDNFPVSLALLDHKQTVVGFVKLRSELPFNKSVFLESLVVAKCERSKGLGRFIVEEVERLVKESGFDRITLTTEDKEGFYLKMGFSRVHPKASNLPSQQTEPTSDASHSLPPPMPSLFRKVEVTAKILMFKDL